MPLAGPERWPQYDPCRRQEGDQGDRKRHSEDREPLFAGDKVSHQHVAFGIVGLTGNRTDFWLMDFGPCGAITTFSIKNLKAPHFGLPAPIFPLCYLQWFATSGRQRRKLG